MKIKIPYFSAFLLSCLLLATPILTYAEGAAQSPADLLAAAQSYRTASEYYKAIVAYKKYLEKNSEDKEAIKGLIYTFVDAGHLGLAREYVQERLAQDSQKNEWLRLFFAEPILHEAAVKAARKGDLKEAFRLFEEALKETNNAPEIMSDYIFVLTWANRYEEAIAAYESLPAGYTIPNYTRLAIARSFRAVGKYDQAVVLYQEYLGLAKEDKEVTLELLNTYLEMKQFDRARQYIQDITAKDAQRGKWLGLFRADILLREDKIEEAENIYSQALREDLGNIHAQLGIAKILLLKGKFKMADFMLDQILAKEPKNIEALFCKGDILEAQRDFLAAYQLYAQILTLYPNSLRARNSQYRALMNLGSNSLVREKLEVSKEPVSPEIYEQLLGNEAMARIWWKEPDVALKILERNQKIAKEFQKQQVVYNENLAEFWDRIDYDQALALREQEKMEEVMRGHAMLKSLKKEIPPWVEEGAADSYLYAQKPEKSLDLYKKLYYSEGWDPNYGSTRMSMYHNLVEMGQYRLASNFLEGLDVDMPVQIIDRGILQDNLRKQEIAYDRGWWLIYQGRFRQAQEYLKDVLSRAPSDTNVRTALAHLYLWRGWPRLSLQEFEIINTMDPNDVAGQIGYCYALNENDRGREARQKAEELLWQYPKNKHVQALNRYFKVLDKPLFKVNFDYTAEDPGVIALEGSAKIAQPIAPWRSLFAGFFFSDSKEDEFKRQIRRSMVGMDSRLTRDWWFNTSLSADKDGKDFGYAGELIFNPNDYLFFNAAYNSYAIDVPLRASVTGIDAREWNWGATYRASEDFIAESKGAYMDYSDGNIHRAYSLRLDKGVTTAPYWKTRLALEGYTDMNSKTDRDYFSPAYLYTVYMVPMVEHTWYRRYNKAMVDRLYGGMGWQWEKGYHSQDVWYGRYEQDYALSDTFSFLVGATFSRKNYDGEDSNVTNIYFELNNRF